MPEKIIKDITENALPIFGFASFGGIALYLHQVRKGKPFSFITLLINAILAGWIGTVVFISGVTDGFEIGIQVGLISITGFLSYPILDFLENKGFDLLFKKLLGKQ